jgi:hypothetical protein
MKQIFNVIAGIVLFGAALAAGLGPQNAMAQDASIAAIVNDQLITTNPPRM